MFRRRETIIRKVKGATLIDADSEKVVLLIYSFYELCSGVKGDSIEIVVQDFSHTRHCNKQMYFVSFYI